MATYSETQFSVINMAAATATLVAAQAAGELPVDGTGDDHEEHVEVDVQRDGRRKRIQVEEAHGVSQPVLDQHALRIAGDDRLEGRV